MTGVITPLDRALGDLTASIEFGNGTVSDDTLDVLLDEQRRRRRERAPARLSMSTMRRGEACPLSMYLARVTGDVAGPEAIAGRAFHEVADAIAFRARMIGEPTLTIPEGLAIANRVLARIDEPLRGAGRRDVLGWVRRWAPTVAFNVDADEFLVEQLWTHDLDLHTLSARLDRVERTGSFVQITDYKTGRPPWDDDYIYDAFQPKNYAWHAALKFPDAETFEITEDFVRSGHRFTVMYDREDCETWIHDWLAALALRLGRAWATGRFVAQPGSWCARCPAPNRCSLPEDTRPLSVRDPETLTERAAAVKVMEARAKQDRESLKLLADLLGISFPVGDQVLGYVEKTKRQAMNVTDARRLGREDERQAALDAYDSIKIDKVTREFGWHTNNGGTT